MQFSRCRCAFFAKGPVNRLAAYANFRFRALYSQYSEYGGDKGNRTLDLLLARQALSQLSYAPTNSGSGPED